MKKIYSIISIMALVALVAGCAKDITVSNAFSVELTVPISSETKTTLGNKTGNTYPVYWSSSDVITLNGTPASSFVPGSGNTSASASFEVEPAAPYNFLYRGVEGRSDQVVFPSTQDYVEDGFDPEAMPMYASLNSVGSVVPMNHVGALLRFSLTGSKKIDSVTLKAEDGNQALSGTFTIGKTGALLNGTLTPSTKGAELLYQFGHHIQLSSDPFVFYVAVPAGTYAGGISLTIVDNASGSMTIRVMTGSNNTIAAGTVREFSNVAYSPTSVSNLIKIWNVDTFQDFVSRVANGETGLNALLTQNASTLNLSSIASSFVPIENYVGTFDGQGKTISGLTKPLFGTLKGVVKNLTLNSNINETSASQSNIGLFARRVVLDTHRDEVAGIYNCTANGSLRFAPSGATTGDCCFGGIVGELVGGEAVNCTNKASITLVDNDLDTNTGSFHVGGICGFGNRDYTWSLSARISDCTNTGSITVPFSGGNTYIGGIAGRSLGEIRSCKTSGGSISFAGTNADGPLYAGGITGHAKAAVKSCTNAMEISLTGTFSPSGSDYYATGGIVGYQAEDAQISDCANLGDVTWAQKISSNGYTFLGGVAGRTNGDIVSCSNDGTVTFSGKNSAQNPFIGGIVGTSVAGKSISATNRGDVVINTSSQTNKYFYVGGIAGRAYSQVDASNSGALRIERLKCTNLYLGGICGYAADVASFAYASNSGAIALAGGPYNVVYVGGILAHGVSSDLDHSSNYGDITFDGLTLSQIFCGGIVGAWNDTEERTISYCENHGEIKTLHNGNSSVSDLLPKVYACPTSYFGGISGSGPADQEGKKYSNCNNYGDITIWSPIRVAIGGIAGAAKTPPVNSSSRADIIFKRYKAAFTEPGQEAGTEGQSYVGGIVGFSNTKRNFSNLLFRGTINTNGSSPLARVGGIVGQASLTGTYTFTNCKVGGTLHGPNSGAFIARLFAHGSDNAERSFNFVNCMIETGTVRQASSATTFNSNSDVTISRCVPDNCTLVENGTLPTVGNIN